MFRLTRFVGGPGSGEAVVLEQIGPAEGVPGAVVALTWSVLPPESESESELSFAYKTARTTTATIKSSMTTTAATRVFLLLRLDL
jgi:hypothetical protein